MPRPSKALRPLLALVSYAHSIPAHAKVLIAIAIVLSGCDSNGGSGDNDVSLHVIPCPATYDMRPGQRSAPLDLELHDENGEPQGLVMGDPEDDGVSFSMLPAWASEEGSFNSETISHTVLTARTDAPVGTNSEGTVSLHTVSQQANCVAVIHVLAGGYYTLAATGDTLIAEGGQATISVTVERHGGFTGAVDLSLEILPNGLSGSFSPSTVPPGATESTLTLSHQGGINSTFVFTIVATDAGAGGATTRLPYRLHLVDAPSPSGWSVVQEVSGVSEFRDLACPSSSVCYAVGGAVGGGPAAYKTTDGGATWSNLPLGAPAEAFAVQFFDEQNGYIGGHDAFSGTGGYLLKTTDGGATWTDVGANMPQNLAIRAVHFLDQNNGFAGGGRVADTTKVMVTSNGGSSWTHLPWDVSDDDEIVRMYFWSMTAGYVSVFSNTGFGRVHYTTDGGLTWNLSSGGTTFTDVRGELAAPSFNNLFSTSSPGATWSSEEVPGILNIIGVTTQGGRTWVAGDSGALALVAYKEGGAWTTDWAAGVGEAPGQLVDIEMFSNTEGVAVGFNFMARRIP